MTPPGIVYVLPDKMGGLLNIVASLVASRPNDGLKCHVVLTDNVGSEDTRYDGGFAADSQHTVPYRLPLENLHAVLARLRKAIPSGGGVLVCNDLLELALLHVYDPGRMVVQILHADHDYYYDLAARHEGVVDVFFTYSRAMHATLQARLPHRQADILYMPYGVPLPREVRSPMSGPLRLVFAGRLDEQKGVLDLPLIDRAVRDAGVEVHWTVIGGGPDEPRMRERWINADVDWRGPLSHEAVLAALGRADVFVLPTRSEGFPVALVEAMGAGLVPVVSNIPSGVPEVVDDGITGFRPPLCDIGGFARAIELLSRDRVRLEAMSRAARAAVAQRFDPRTRTGEYHRIYQQWHARLGRRRTRPGPLPYGSRLDQPWIPNALVRAIRGSLRHRRGVANPKPQTIA